MGDEVQLDGLHAIHVQNARLEGGHDVWGTDHGHLLDGFEATETAAVGAAAGVHRRLDAVLHGDCAGSRGEGERVGARSGGAVGDRKTRNLDLFERDQRGRFVDHIKDVLRALAHGQALELLLCCAAPDGDIERVFRSVRHLDGNAIGG